MKKIISVLFFVFFAAFNCAAGARAISPEINIEADIVSYHSAKEYGADMYYLSRKEDHLYMVMHGWRDGTVMDGISVKNAVNEILEENREKLAGTPFNKITIVCCYPGAHSGYINQKHGFSVSFVSKSQKELRVHITDKRISFCEWEED